MSRDREEGYWAPPGAAAVVDVSSGNQLIPSVPPDALANGTGVGILAKTFSRIEPRILTLGIPSANPIAGGAFPGVAFNGPVFGSTSCGMVDSASNPFSLLNLACSLEYGSGSASQHCWIDWYQGSYNLPACEFVRVSALPWGTSWGLFPLNSFNAVASVSPGQIQGAHVPTVTTVGAFVAGVLRVVGTPANARAFEVLCTDPTVNTTVTISGACSGTRNLNTGVVVPGWSPLELDLGFSAIGITASANCNLRLQFYIQL